MPRTASICSIEVAQGCMNFPKTKVKRRIFGVKMRDVKQFHSDDPQILASRVTNIFAWATCRPVVMHQWRNLSDSGRSEVYEDLEGCELFIKIRRLLRIPEVNYWVQNRQLLLPDFISIWTSINLWIFLYRTLYQAGEGLAWGQQGRPWTSITEFQYWCFCARCGRGGVEGEWISVCNQTLPGFWAIRKLLVLRNCKELCYSSGTESI